MASEIVAIFEKWFIFIDYAENSDFNCKSIAEGWDLVFYCKLSNLVSCLMAVFVMFLQFVWTYFEWSLSIWIFDDGTSSK